MDGIYERLRQLKVADCMSTHVVPVAARQSMASAACDLLNGGFSGSPVVDEHGRCVGMLSAVDFMRQQADCTSGRPASSYARSRTAADEAGFNSLEIEEIFEETVSRHMNPAVQSVGLDTPLCEAAKIMCNCHIHRLPVLDECLRPAGMLTSLDLAAVLVNLLDEAEQARQVD